MESRDYTSEIILGHLETTDGCLAQFSYYFVSTPVSSSHLNFGHRNVSPSCVWNCRNL